MIIKKFLAKSEKDAIEMAKNAADDDIQALRENATIKASAVQIAGITEDEFDALDETAQKEYLDAAIVKAYDTDNGITTGRDYTNKAYVMR